MVDLSKPHCLIKTINNAFSLKENEISKAHKNDR